MSILINFPYTTLFDNCTRDHFGIAYFWDQCFVVTCHKALIFVDLLYVFFFISACVHDFIIAVMSFFATMFNQRQLLLAFC